MAPLRLYETEKRLASPVTVRDRIPMTTVARTLADLPATLPPRLVRRAIRQAEFLGLGLGEIKTDRTRSDLERYFLRLCRRYGLPLPEVNVKIDGMTRRLGYSVHRFSERQLEVEPAAVVEDVVRALSR